MRKTKTRQMPLEVPRFNQRGESTPTSSREPDHRSSQDMALELRANNLALESKLQENARLKQQREGLIRHLEFGVIMTTSTGLVSAINELAAEILGQPREYVMGLPLEQIWVKSGLPPVPCSSIRHQDRFLTCQDHIIDPLGNQGKEVMRIIKDVTMVKTLQDQLVSQQRLSVMGEMIGTIAHEIRNPLGSIELFASLLGTSVHDDAERQTLAKHIATVVRSLDHVLSNLLMMTKNLSPNMQTVSLEALVHDVIMMGMHAIRDRSITVRENLCSSGRTVCVDEPLLKQALLNLLLNGIQASSENGIVEISSQWVSIDATLQNLPQNHAGLETREAVIVSVRDYGCGIRREDQGRMFEPFFSKRNGGTGLGLAIVRQIMEAHHGWIECLSREGNGTTMMLWIPQWRKR